VASTDEQAFAPNEPRLFLARSIIPCKAAERSWRRLDGHNQLPKVILGVKFADGIEVVTSHAQAAA
jgi:putative transposase